MKFIRGKIGDEKEVLKKIKELNSSIFLSLSFKPEISFFADLGNIFSKSNNKPIVR